jgi:predicted DNA-binding protein (MmcQ/YjbR family)
MTPEAFHAAALALPGATFDIKWGADRVYSVGGKMFVVADPEDEAGAATLSFKVSDLAFEMLAEQGIARPAPYLARAKWVQLASRDALEDGDLKRYLAEAHRLVALGLTKKARAALGLTP